MSLETLKPLIKSSGSSLSPEKFHEAVNIAFHNSEAAYYDALHASMWESLQQQVDLLASDALTVIGDKKNLNLLDIGCGTGLSTQMLLNSPLGAHVGSATLLDTSLNMLREAEKKAKSWNKEYTTVNGSLDALDGKYDLVIISSVLHHIPGLEAFIQKVSTLQPAGGIILHLQDPNGDYMNDAAYLERVQHLGSKPAKADVKNGLIQNLKSALRRLLGQKNYIDRVNDELIKQNAIKNRMSAEEIWSVTDIHVEGLPFSIGGGISINFLQSIMSSYKLVNQRSYSFFGKLKSELPASLQAEEDRLIDARELSGRNVSAVWIKSAN